MLDCCGTFCVSIFTCPSLVGSPGLSLRVEERAGSCSCVRYIIGPSLGVWVGHVALLGNCTFLRFVASMSYSFVRLSLAMASLRPQNSTFSVGTIHWFTPVLPEPFSPRCLAWLTLVSPLLD